MRLLHATTMKMREFLSNDIPKYAILSHTWGEEEVTFQDMQNGKAHKKKGYTKILKCCQQAVKDGYNFVWIDTCCIDKSSSAELSEAINSMFLWYGMAAECYAYLSDLPFSIPLRDLPGRFPPRDLEARFPECRWFTRGWTLQELLAPREVTFFSREWIEVGNRSQWRGVLCSKVRIHEEALTGDVEKVQSFSIAQKFSWISKRTTTREEDIAYSLLGIFNVHMPLLYGEGSRAFLRLQEEIMKSFDDHSIFSWHWDNDKDFEMRGLLAPSPAPFFPCHTIVPFRNWKSSEPFQMTNVGLRMKTSLLHHDTDPTSYLILECYDENAPERMLGIPLKQLSPHGDQYGRVRGPEYFIGTRCRFLPVRTIYVRNSIILPEAHIFQSAGQTISFLVATNFDGPRLCVKDAWPRRQWSNGMIKPPVLSGNHGTPDPAFFNWSWHVALLVDIQLSEHFTNGDSNCEQVVVIGYNGRNDMCWCAISSGLDYNLDDTWTMTPYSGCAEFGAPLYPEEEHRSPRLTVTLIDPNGVIASSPITPNFGPNPPPIKVVLRIDLPSESHYYLGIKSREKYVTNQ